MKKYVFITFSIVEVGGSQVYVNKKRASLEADGWQVTVFSADQGELMIDELKKYEPLINFRYGYSPISFSGSKRYGIVKKMAEQVGGGADEIIIESHSGIFGLWGEMLARELKATHLLYCIEEKCIAFSQSHFRFLKFKWSQHALAGISPIVIKNLFFNNGEEIDEDQSYYLVAFGNNPLEDVQTHVKLPAMDENICLMGRLEKAFMYPTAQIIAEYVKDHSKKNYNVLIIGGSTKLIYSSKISALFKGIENCNLNMTGNMFPIPYSLLKQMSVLVSSAGCCRLGQSVGIPTISIDAQDLKPIGVLGYTTNQSIFRNDEPVVDLSDLLDEILEEKKYKKEIKPFEPSIPDYSIHYEFVKNINQDLGYYDVDSIDMPLTTILKAKLKRILLCTIGYRNYIKLSKCKSLLSFCSLLVTERTKSNTAK